MNAVHTTLNQTCQAPAEHPSETRELIDTLENCSRALPVCELSQNPVTIEERETGFVLSEN